MLSIELHRFRVIENPVRAFNHVYNISPLFDSQWTRQFIVIRAKAREVLSYLFLFRVDFFDADAVFSLVTDCVCGDMFNFRNLNNFRVDIMKMNRLLDLKKMVNWDDLEVLRVSFWLDWAEMIARIHSH